MPKCDFNKVHAVVLMFWTYFTPFSSASIVDFEQLNVRTNSLVSISVITVKFNPFLANVPLLLPHENIKETEVFWSFQGL